MVVHIAVEEDRCSHSLVVGEEDHRNRRILEVDYVLVRGY